MKNFAHLHVHTDHSFLDSCIKIPDLIARAQNLEMPAIAITDHGNLCGAIKFYNEAKRNGIKPIIGLEAYFVKQYSQSKHQKNQIYHQTLIAQNYEGFLNLSKLTSESHSRGFFRRPCIDFETLAKYSKGIIALSGCINGIISQYLLYSDYENAREATAKFVDVFGRDNYFIELQNHGFAEEKKICPGLVKLAKEFGLKMVATNDCYYLSKEDATAHDNMLCIATASCISDEDRLRYPNDEFYLKTREEMERTLPNSSDILDNTLLVSEMCDLQIKMKESHNPKTKCTIDITSDADKAELDRIINLPDPSDFEIDVCVRQRGSTIEYLKAKYGEISIANIIAFRKFSLKQAFKDVARVNGLPFERRIELAENIPNAEDMSLDKVCAMSPKFRAEVDNDKIIKQVFEVAKKLEGAIRQTGNHDDKFIITKQNNLVPTMIQNGSLTTQFPVASLEDLGVLRLNFVES